MTARLAMFILGSLLAASCGSSPAHFAPADNSTGSQRSTGETGGFEGWEQWQQILSDPGIAGIDYDPRSITVNYRPDAVFELSGNFAPPPGYRAADKPNAILRQDARYETITDHISGRYGITIQQQVYAHGVLLASFRLQELQNGMALIEDIRASYGQQVLDVTYSRLIRPSFDPNDKYYLLSDSTGGGQWGLHRIGTPQAWQRSTGDPGLLIGVVDSGCLLSHEDIGTAVLDPAQHFPQASCDLLDGDTDISDTDGHGTAVCSVLAAKTDNLLGLAAMLPTSRVLPIRISQGSATSQAHVVAGCMLAAELGCSIVNLSWSAPSGSRQLSQMADSLAARGVLLMAAAGNSGDMAQRWPAAYSTVCGVAASNQQDSLAMDASHGAWCDLSAPGTGFSVPDIRRNNLYFESVSGSSLACALASGAAGLLRSIEPSLTPDEIRQRLIDNARPLTGGGPPRIDLAAVLQAIDAPQLSLPGPTELLQQDFLTLQPLVGGAVSRLELWIDDNYVMSRTQAPWQLTADLRGLAGGPHRLELRALSLDQQNHASAGFDFLRRMPELPMPWQQGFEAGSAELHSLELGGYDPALQQSLREAAGFVTTEDFEAGGQLGWKTDNTQAWQGLSSLRLDSSAQPAQPARLQALLSQPILLAGYPDPTLSLAARWQLDDLHCALLLSADDGQSWVFPPEQSGFSGSFSGLQDNWRQLRYDLSAWSGQSVQLLLLSELPADSLATGEGLWIDALSIATGFQSSLPVISGVQLARPVVGAVPGIRQLKASLQGAQNVQTARYWLDCAPLGSLGPEDVQATALLGADLAVSLSLPPAQNGNRHAVLRVDYLDAQGALGPRYNLPVWIFDRRGDADADGQVSGTDLAAYEGRLGLHSSDDLYDPFLDSDLDGWITELDAAAVAYNFD